MRLGKVLTSLGLFFLSLLLSGVAFATESFKLTPNNAAELQNQNVKFHYSVDAGDVVEDSLHVTRKFLYGQNPTVDVNFFPVDGHITQNGYIGMSSEFDEQQYVGAWTVMGKSTETMQYEIDVPFRIQVPINATPGQYIGGFVVTDANEESDQENKSEGSFTKIKIRHAISLRVDVKGEIKTDFEVKNINYEIDSGILKASFDFVNKGNVIHEFSGFYLQDGIFMKENIPIPPKTVLPGETVHFEIENSGFLRFLGGFDVDLHIETNVQLQNESISLDFDTNDHINYFPPTAILALLFIFLAIYGIIHRIILKKSQTKNVARIFFKNKKRSKV